MKDSLRSVVGITSLTIADDKLDLFIESTTKLYCEIWAEPPWNETHWTEQGVAEDIRTALSRTGAHCYVAVRRSGHAFGSIVGFTWGYRVSPAELHAISHSEHVAKLAERPTFYIAELGVQRAYRSSGIGLELSEELIDQIRERGFRQAVLRTHIHAVAARKLYERLGFRELPFADGTHPDRTYWILTL